MGLDTVELMMRVEDDFGIEIPDEVAETLVTVGMLSDFIVAELGRVSGVPQDPEAVYDMLKAIICEQTGVEADAVVRDASFVKDLRLD